MGVSDSETCTSEAANPIFLARSASHRAKKVLPQPYSPRTALKTLPRGLDGLEFLVQRVLEPFKARGEGVQAVTWHRSSAQSVDDLVASLRADRHGKYLRQIKLAAQEFSVELNGVRSLVPSQDRITLNIENHVESPPTDPADGRKAAASFTAKAAEVSLPPCS